MSTKPYVMEAPRRYAGEEGKRAWDRDRAYLVEYLLWRAGRAMSARRIGEELGAKFQHFLSSSFRGQILRQLCDEQRIYRVARGVYAHSTHDPFELPEPVAVQPAVDIFS